MRTVTYKSVSDAVARRAGLDPATWDAGTQATVAEFIGAWAKKGWEWEFWPEWTVLEQRAYRDAYVSGTTYAAPTATVPVEVWFPAAQKYAQALQSTVGHDPFTFANGVWTANGPYWAESGNSYTGDDWEASTVYAAGTNVRNPADNRYYQCITAHTSGGTFDATKFGILTTFERYVSLDQTGLTPIGEVHRVSRSNPRTNPRFPGVVTFTMDDKGILPAPLAGSLVWVEFRLRPPLFTSTAWSGGTAYVAGDVVYVAATGECYVALQAGTNQAPATQPAYWRKQNFPFVLAEFVKWAAYADLLRTQGQNEKGNEAEAKAFNQLSQASDVALASQGQYERATAAVYC